MTEERWNVLSSELRTVIEDTLPVVDEDDEEKENTGNEDTKMKQYEDLLNNDIPQR